MIDAGQRVSSFAGAASLRALLVVVVMLFVPLVSVASAGRPLGNGVLELAFSAASCAVRAGSVESPDTLTVIDYSKPSTEKRLWVFDLRTRAVLYEELVAHGQGTGDAMATSFSNEPDTHKSSLGLFVTEEAYAGKNGYSLRLNGLDAGFNDRARERAIVMHGAPYVSEAFAQAQGRLGRSWGCPALREAVARRTLTCTYTGTSSTTTRTGTSPRRTVTTRPRRRSRASTVGSAASRRTRSCDRWWSASSMGLPARRRWRCSCWRPSRTRAGASST